MMARRRIDTGELCGSDLHNDVLALLLFFPGCRLKRHKSL
jgi:hypothetical protein